MVNDKSYGHTKTDIINYIYSEERGYFSFFFNGDFILYNCQPESIVYSV